MSVWPVLGGMRASSSLLFALVVISTIGTAFFAWFTDEVEPYPRSGESKDPECRFAFRCLDQALPAGCMNEYSVECDASDPRPCDVITARHIPFTLARDTLHMEHGSPVRWPRGWPGHTCYVDPELMALLPPTDPIGSEIRYKTCAVVGSSGAIWKSGRGAEIDAHDAIIRFNDAPIVGYENDVGVNTTFRVINDQVVAPWFWKTMWMRLRGQMAPATGWKPGDPRESLILRANGHVRSVVIRKWLAMARASPSQAMYIIPPSTMWSARQCFAPAYASSGFFGTMLALRMCDDIDLYGFHPPDPAPGNELLREHYWDPKFANGLKNHSYSKERQMYSFLAAIGRIKTIT